MPTHFRYVPVAKAPFGLNASEILLADDKDLNEYVGLKKLAPYRKQRDTWDAKRGERLREFKKKVSGRLEETGTNESTMEHLVDGEHKAKKRKGKKERARDKATQATEGTEVVQKEQSEDMGENMGITASSEPVKKKRRRQKKSETPRDSKMVRTAGTFRSLLSLCGCGYERSNVFIDIGLRNAILKAVLQGHVYPMDIFRLWDIGASRVSVDVYEGIYGFLRGCLTIAGRRP